MTFGWLPRGPGKGSYVRWAPGGRIVQTGSTSPVTLDAQIAAGEPVLRGTADPATQWVNGGRIADKTDACPAVLDGLTLKNLPKPSMLVIEGELYEVADGVAELAFDYPGTYEVRVISGPFLDRVFKVEVP